MCLRSRQGGRGTPARAHASPDMYPWAHHVQTEAPGLQAQTLVPPQAACPSARIRPKCPPAVPPSLVLGKGPGPAHMACQSPGRCCAPADTTCPDPACKEHAEAVASAGFTPRPCSRPSALSGPMHGLTPLALALRASPTPRPLGHCSGDQEAARAQPEPGAGPPQPAHITALAAATAPGYRAP